MDTAFNSEFVAGNKRTNKSRHPKLWTLSSNKYVQVIQATHQEHILTSLDEFRGTRQRMGIVANSQFGSKCE